MLRDLEKMNLAPTAAMYNAIMAGYFREVTGSWSYEIRSVFIFWFICFSYFLSLPVLYTLLLSLYLKLNELLMLMHRLCLHLIMFS